VGVLCQLECEGPYRAEMLRWMPGYSDASPRSEEPIAGATSPASVSLALRELNGAGATPGELNGASAPSGELNGASAPSGELNGVSAALDEPDADVPPGEPDAVSPAV
jgi:hypothetical protein